MMGAMVWLAAFVSVGTLGQAAYSKQELVPLALEAEPAELVKVNLRGRHVIWTWATRAGQRMSVRVRCRQLGSYTAPLELAYPAEGTARASAQAQVGEEAELTFTAAEAGLVGFSATAGANAYQIVNGPTHLAVEASPARRLHICGGGELYFYVPRGAREFSVVVRGQGTGETARVGVVDPTGHEVASGEAIKGLTATVKVSVREHAGDVWKLAISKASEGTLEDVYLHITGDAAPFVFLRRTGAVVPFCWGLYRQPTLVTDLRAAAVRVGLNNPSLARQGGLVARLEREGEVVAKGQAKAGDAELSLALPSLRDAAYMLVVELVGKGGQVLHRSSASLELRNGVLYAGGVRPLLEVQLTCPETPDKPVTAELALALRGAKADDVQVSAELYRCGISEDPTGPEAELLARDERLQRTGLRWTAASPAPLADGTYQWLFTVRSRRTGKPVFWQRVHWVVFREKVFPETWSQASAPPPSGLLSAGEPVVVAVPAEQDAPPSSYMPSAAELTAPLQVAAARGESRAAIAVVIALRDVAQVRAEMGDLAGPGGARLRPTAVEIRVGRYWAQRTSWRSGNCWIVPELLELRQTWPMRRLQPAILWLTFRVPQTARPGLYRGTLTITADGRRARKAVQLRVYPFSLVEPREYHWGLYTDSGRWRRYSATKVEAEMRDYVAHGITSLMMYPPTHSEITRQRGVLTIDASQFVGYMDMAKRLGLRPPTVFSFQALAGVTNRLVDVKKEGQATWDTVYRDIALHFDRLAKERGWGEVVYHAIDEPHGGEVGKRAVHWLGILKRAGLTTFTTALDPTLVNGPLDPYLDVRCWSVGYVLGSKQGNAKARADCERSGDRLWYYGSGSYTGQEGRMLANRWLSGCGLWISGAEGEWSWTFLRPKDDAFNDFDGARHREAKDAMIAYPSAGNAPPIPTPQWEGLREGTNDFKYLYTARLAAVRKGGKVGRRCLAEVEKMTREMPWGVRPVGLTCQRLDAWRERAARIIIECAPD